MKKIVIIGANDFQRPLIQKAKQMGYETHVFAWREGAVGAEDADQFYEISITEKEKILEICREIKPEGVATIGSDLANITVQYLTERLGLVGNTEECIKKSTNKFLMRKAFQRAGIPVPFFQSAGQGEKIEIPGYPVIVKPTDRSGSRAITKVEKPEELEKAVQEAIDQSFEKRAMIEEYLPGAEYSVETISYEGKHACLAITKKFTTGAPHYIEKGHLQPAPLSEIQHRKIEKIVFQALDALEIKYGAAHSELRIDEEENIHIIEIGSRMGGDCIGSDLVPLSSGYDYVKMVIDIACGSSPAIFPGTPRFASIRFLMCEKDKKHLDFLKKNYPQCIKKEAITEEVNFSSITDSGSRPGFYILQADTEEEMARLLCEGPENNPVHIFETPVQKLLYGAEKNNIYVKRDDLLPFSFGGNKVRFARKFIDDMKEKQCDSMIIYGNYHSNLCRILSAACRQMEMPCYMIHNVEDICEEQISCNEKLIKMMGVTEIPCTKKNIQKAVEKAFEDLREQGYRPYYIYGNSRGEGNEWVPMEAYREAYEEIKHYEGKTGIKFDYIFLASSTNATQSGLLAGSLMENDQTAVVGISVSRRQARGEEVIKQNLQKYAERFQRKLPADWEEKIIFTDAYLEGGYGSFSEDIQKTILKECRENGIPLDMTYTGKAFWGMKNWIKERQITGKNILFWHTGGTPLFFDLLEKKTGKWEWEDEK